VGIGRELGRQKSELFFPLASAAVPGRARNPEETAENPARGKIQRRAEKGEPGKWQLRRGGRRPKSVWESGCFLLLETSRLVSRERSETFRISVGLGVYKADGARDGFDRGGTRGWW
jgi:hypothetical protein